MKTVHIGDLPVGDGHPPRIMGVLNMSIESNYTPSVHGEVQQAVEYVEEHMVPEGADIIDIGLQSSNPVNDWLPPEVEHDRLSMALEVVDRADVPDDVAFSIETRYADVADEAVAGGFDLVNDVCGFADPDMRSVCESHDVPVVKMASPPDIKKPGHLRTVDEAFEALQRDGFTDKTILDPAFGGWYDERTYEDNWELFRRLREFRAFGRPILTATNREDFLGDIADRPETQDQLAVSLAAATMEVERGAHIIRTHDIPETKDVVQVAHFLGDERVVADSPRVVELTNVGGRELERNAALRKRRAGDPESATSLTFQVDDLSASERDTLAAWADDHDLTLLDGEEAGLVLSGARSRFRAGVDALSEEGGALAELAGSVRSALARRVSNPS